MSFSNLKLHFRLIVPLGLCLFVIVSAAMVYLFFHSSGQISVLSKTNIGLIQNLSDSNVKQMTDLLEANLHQFEDISTSTVQRFEEFQIKNAEDMLQLTSRPFEKAFDTGDKRAVRTWLHRQNQAEGVEEVSVIKADGVIAFSSDKQLLGTRIAEDVLAQAAASGGKFRRWADNGLETFVTKSIERKCIRCHVHHGWQGKVGETAGYFYLRISTEAFNKLKNQNEIALAEQMAKNKAVLARQIAEIKILSTALKEKNEAGLEEINGSNAEVFAVTIFGIIVISALLLFFLVKKIVSKPINRMIDSLTNESHTLSATCDRITSTSQSLAATASQQAASIEETAASLEQISSATKQNASHADQADSLMSESNRIIEDANSTMTELNGSMDKISTASEETFKIIKTIDEIAFQTNLLALNAAVEAARAGEAGAGFAVVAEEVRSLALRASTASKNTSELVQGTVGQIGDGLELVKKTNDAFSAVTRSTDEVSSLISRISAASKEQALGIEQVNNAVIEMDKITQQNAASAEDGAAASTEMNVQADQMKKFVEVLTHLVNGRANNTAKETAEKKNQRQNKSSRRRSSQELNEAF